MDSYYNAPGAAAGDAIQQFMIQQAAQRRQAMLDNIAASRETREARNQEQELQTRRDELNDRRQERMLLLHERENKSKEDAVNKARDDAETAKKNATAEHDKTLANMVPGDIMTPDMVAADKLVSGGQNVQDPKQGLKNFMSTLPAGSPEQAGVAAQTQGPMTFVGNRQDRDKIAAQKELDNYILRLAPDSISRKVAEAKRSGVNLTAADLKLENPADDQESVFTYNPVNGEVRDSSTGKTVTSVPKGAKIERLAEPKDHSASNSAAEDRRNNKLLQTQQHAYDELNKRAQPIEEQINNLNKIDTSLNQNSNMADSTIAEQVIKITAGGAGSGVRITQPEIDQVLKRTRTKWQDLEIAFNKWGGDPKKELILNTEQKQGLRDLMKAIRVKANTLHQKIIKARTDIDKADDTDTVHEVNTRLSKELYGDSESTSPATSGKQIRYGMDGKVIQ